jgi:hypothetical protein
VHASLLVGIQAPPPDKSTRCYTDESISFIPGTNNRYIPPGGYTVLHRTIGYGSTVKEADGLTSASCPASDTGGKPTGTIPCAAHKERRVEL